MAKISIRDLKSKGEDLLNGLLFKYTITAGRGDTASMCNEVELELRMFVDSRLVLEYSTQPYVKIVEEILPPGLSFAISNMLQGERALIWMHSLLGFATDMLPSDSQIKIPKDTPLVFEVHLKSFVINEASLVTLKRNKKLTVESMPLVQKEFDLAQSLMLSGRKLRALRSFRNCLHTVRQMRIDARQEPAQHNARNELAFLITLKTAECAFAVARFPLAVSLSKEALQEKPFDANAHYICGSAYFALGLNSSACRYLRQAHHNDLNNETYKKKLHDVDRHCALLEKDPNYDSDAEEFEDYAELLLHKIVSNEKILRRKVSSFINRKTEQGTRTLKIGGGFRPQFLDMIRDKLVALPDKTVRVCAPHRDALTLYF